MGAVRDVAFASVAEDWTRGQGGGIDMQSIFCCKGGKKVESKWREVYELAEGCQRAKALTFLSKEESGRTKDGIECCTNCVNEKKQTTRKCR